MPKYRIIKQRTSHNQKKCLWLKEVLRVYSIVLLIMNFGPFRCGLNLLGERLVLQGSCAFLAALMVFICLYFVRLDARSS